MGKNEYTTGAVCPDCGHKNDGFTHMDDPSARPRAGAIGVCAYCSCVSVYESAGTLRKLTPEEWKSLETHAPKVVNDLKKAIQVTREFQESQKAKYN